MPKDSRSSKPGAAQETVFAVNIALPTRHVPLIEEISIAGLDADASSGVKMATIAEGAVLDLCEGGIMLNHKVMQKLGESFGRIPVVDEIVELFQKGVGRKDSKLQITISLDPAYEAVVKQAADFQGVTEQECMQNCWDTAWDNGDFYDPRPHADRILMTNDNKAELVKLLGKDFSTGTDLFKLMKQFIADHEGLFSEVADK